MNYKHAIWAPAFAVALLGLAACENSSDDFPPESQPETTGPLSISEANAKLVVSASTETLRLAPYYLNSLNRNAGIIGDFIEWGLDGGSQMILSSGKVTPMINEGPGSEDSFSSVACMNEGGTISGNLSRPSPGEEFDYREISTLDATNCEIFGLTLDGSVTLTFEVVEGQTSVTFYETFDFNQLTINGDRNIRRLAESGGEDTSLNATLSGSAVLVSGFGEEGPFGPNITFSDLSISSPDGEFPGVTLASGDIMLNAINDFASETPQFGLSLAADSLALAIELNEDNTIEVELNTEGSLTAVNTMEFGLVPSGDKISPLALEGPSELEDPAFIATEGTLAIDSAADTGITLDTAKGGELEMGYILNGSQETVVTHESMGANFDYTTLYESVGSIE
ncbi:MAG: hypothetical protein ACQES2_02265 [Pseudomonadota bacterium]